MTPPAISAYFPSIPPILFPRKTATTLITKVVQPINRMADTSGNLYNKIKSRMPISGFIWWKKRIKIFIFGRKRRCLLFWRLFCKNRTTGRGYLTSSFFVPQITKIWKRAMVDNLCRILYNLKR